MNHDIWMTRYTALLGESMKEKQIRPANKNMAEFVRQSIINYQLDSEHAADLVLSIQ